VRIAFNIAVGVWVLSEWGIRRRSHLNREGSRLDHGSTLVVVASTVAGVVGALALARAIHGAAVPEARGLFVAGLVLMGAGIAFRQWAVAVLGGRRAGATGANRPTVGLVYRIHFEERALSQGLGEPYRRFAASRPRLFPGCGHALLTGEHVFV
jgi:protein-S-isoprenylcysteine O-methyltransferase Ste14